MATRIENGVVIAWIDGRHQVVDPGLVVFDGNAIVYAGPPEAGPPAAPDDQFVEATDRLIIPGLVNAHLHVTDTAFTKGFLEDTGGGNKGATGYLGFHSLYRVLPQVRHAADGEAQAAAAACAFAELARTGSTTVVELGFDAEIGGGGDIRLTEQVATIGAETGLRVYSGPRYRTWHYGDDGSGGVFYEAYPNQGRDRFDACARFAQDWNGKYDDRLRTMLAPGQIDTCAPDLLRDTRALADRLKLPIQIHAGQSPNEFNRVKETQGRTTIELMMETGLLGPDFIIGHGQVLSTGADAARIGDHEVTALSESGTTICHLPWVKARRGHLINSIQKYRDMGIRQCLGTDTHPFDLIHEMQVASVMAKVAENDVGAAPAVDVFEMATAGGADALGRGDLGRLAAGAKADIVFVRLDTPKAAPVYDPFKFLVMNATGEDVDRVIVDGRTIVADGRVLTLDVHGAVQALNAAGSRVRARLDL